MKLRRADDKQRMSNDFAHYLSYSGRWREPEEIRTILREAFEAGWNPKDERFDLSTSDKVLFILFVLIFAALIGVVIGVIR